MTQQIRQLKVGNGSCVQESIRDEPDNNFGFVQHCCTNVKQLKENSIQINLRNYFVLVSESVGHAFYNSDIVQEVWTEPNESMTLVCNGGRVTTRNNYK